MILDFINSIARLIMKLISGFFEWALGWAKQYLFDWLESHIGAGMLAEYWQPATLYYGYVDQWIPLSEMFSFISLYWAVRIKFASFRWIKAYFW